MPTEYTDQPIWNDEKLDVPADGDEAEGLTWYDQRKHADRTRFLLNSTALALANWKRVHNYSSGTENQLRDVCWGPGAGYLDTGCFLAVGHSGPVNDIPSASGYYAVSYDGERWLNRTVADEDYPGSTPRFYGVAHGGPGAFGSKVFVLVGERFGTNGAIYTAPDDFNDPSTGELNLTIRNALNIAGPWRGVCWNGSVFCVVGDGGAIKTCDGVALDTWTSRTPAGGYTGDFSRVRALASGRLVAVGDDGEIQTSDDNGVTWVSRHSQATHGNLLDVTITRSGALLVNFGLSASVDQDKILRSTDNGTTWVTVDLFTVDPALAPRQLDLGSKQLVVRMGSVVACFMRHASAAKFLIALSFDDGLTWPAIVTPPSVDYMNFRGAATDGSVAVVVGGTNDDTAEAYVWQSLRQIMPVSEMV